MFKSYKAIFMGPRDCVDFWNSLVGFGWWDILGFLQTFFWDSYRGAANRPSHPNQDPWELKKRNILLRVDGEKPPRLTGGAFKHVYVHPEFFGEMESNLTTAHIFQMSGEKPPIKRFPRLIHFPHFCPNKIRCQRDGWSSHPTWIPSNSASLPARNSTRNRVGLSCVMFWLKVKRIRYPPAQHIELDCALSNEC